MATPYRAREQWGAVWYVDRRGGRTDKEQGLKHQVRAKLLDLQGRETTGFGRCTVWYDLGRMASVFKGPNWMNRDCLVSAIFIAGLK